MIRLLVACALGASIGGSAAAQSVALTYIALKTQTTYPLPAPVNGIVTLTLASGASIRLRALDIDYERTAAYKTTAVVKAEVVEPKVAPNGRKYLNLAFSTKFVATAWMEDVDYEVMRSGFSAYHASNPTSRSTDEIAMIRQKCARDWPDDFVMRNYCEEEQKKALAKLKGGGGQ